MEAAPVELLEVIQKMAWTVLQGCGQCRGLCTNMTNVDDDDDVIVKWDDLP